VHLSVLLRTLSFDGLSTFPCDWLETFLALSLVFLLIGSFDLGLVVVVEVALFFEGKFEGLVESEIAEVDDEVDELFCFRPLGLVFLSAVQLVSKLLVLFVVLLLLILVSEPLSLSSSCKSSQVLKAIIENPSIIVSSNFFLFFTLNPLELLPLCNIVLEDRAW